MLSSFLYLRMRVLLLKKDPKNHPEVPTVGVFHHAKLDKFQNGSLYKLTYVDYKNEQPYAFRVVNLFQTVTSANSNSAIYNFHEAKSL